MFNSFLAKVAHCHLFQIPLIWFRLPFHFLTLIICQTFLCNKELNIVVVITMKALSQLCWNKQLDMVRNISGPKVLSIFIFLVEILIVLCHISNKNRNLLYHSGEGTNRHLKIVCTKVGRCLLLQPHACWR